jgi:hypothetical protein
VTITSESDLIRQEIAAAQSAIDRYHDLTLIEYREQKQRLAEIEQRLANLERSTAGLQNEMQALLQSRIWRTLVRAAGLFPAGRS